MGTSEAGERLRARLATMTAEEKSALVTRLFGWADEVEAEAIWEMTDAEVEAELGPEGMAAAARIEKYARTLLERNEARAALAAAEARLAEVKAERDREARHAAAARDNLRTMTDMHERALRERDRARAERDYDERIAAEALRALVIAVRRAEGVEAMRDVLRADLRADRLALARLQAAGGTLAHLLQHCRTTVAAERRAGIARWAEALAGGPEPAHGEAQPEAEAARPGHTIPLRLPDAPPEE